MKNLLFVLIVGVWMGGSFCFALESNTDRPGMDYRSFALPAAEPQQCLDACRQEARCKAFTYVKPGVQGPGAFCWLKHGIPPARPNPCCISGVKDNVPPILSPSHGTGDVKRFEYPTIFCKGKEYRLDICRIWGSGCGKKAADAFCRLKGFAEARSWEKEGNIGLQSPTCVIGNGQICNQVFCGGFRYIECAGSSTSQGKGAAITMDYNTARPGQDYRSFDLPDANPALCRDACLKESKCKAYGYVKPGIQGPRARCWLKHGVPPKRPNDCCVSGVKQVGTEENSGQQPTQKESWIKQRARERRISSEKFDDTWQQFVSGRLKQINDQIVTTQRANFQSLFNQLQSRFQHSLPPAIRDAVSNVAAGKVRQAMADEWRPPKAYLSAPGVPEGTDTLRPGHVSPQAAQVKGSEPRIDGLWSIVNPPLPPNTIAEGALLFIFGKNFGTTPGHVRLEYKGMVPEFSHNHPAYQKNLQPYKGTWSSAWHDHVIIVRLPPLTEKDIVKTNASLVVWRDGQQHFVQKVAVHLELNYPTVTNFFTQEKFGNDSKEHKWSLVPGGAILLEGVHFGARKGKIELEVSEPIAGMKKISLLPGNGTWEKSWSDDRIFVKVATNLPKNFAPQHNATLRIWNDAGNGPWEQSVTFGPRMIYTMISGVDFLNLDREDDADEAQEAYQEGVSGAVLVVSHDPGCGWKGNDGNDWFFTDKPLPANVTIVRWTFAPIYPDDGMETIKKLLKELEDWGEKILEKGPYGVLEKWGEYMLNAIAAWIDSDAGSYVAEIKKEPGPSDQSVAIHWENTCYSFSPYAGVPIKYGVSFLLKGPDGVVPGSE